MRWRQARETSGRGIAPAAPTRGLRTRLLFAVRPARSLTDSGRGCSRPERCSSNLLLAAYALLITGEENPYPKVVFSCKAAYTSGSFLHEPPGSWLPTIV
jgi:hypothetical protein